MVLGMFKMAATGVLLLTVSSSLSLRRRARSLRC